MIPAANRGVDLRGKEGSTVGGVQPLGRSGRVIGARVLGERGLTLIEMLVTVGIIGVVLGIATIGLRGSFMQFGSSSQRLINDLRLARADATTRGAHYRLTFLGTTYRIERLEDNDSDGQWEPDPLAAQPARVVFWPADITVSLDGNQGTSGEPCVEFNTRGMLVPVAGQRIAEMTKITLQDSKHNQSKIIQVWPSGQMGFVAEASTGG
jgi:prepilin-type N-terminal cleavage/methylation domain-containing protein